MTPQLFTRPAGPRLGFGQRGGRGTIALIVSVLMLLTACSSTTTLTDVAAPAGTQVQADSNPTTNNDAPSSAADDSDAGADADDAVGDDAVGDDGVGDDAVGDDAVGDDGVGDVSEGATNDTPASGAPITAEGLARARVNVEQAESFRFEMFMEMDAGIMQMGGRDAPLATGEIDGELASITMDFNSMFAAFGDEVPPGDFSMRMITDGTGTYMNAPFFGAMGLDQIAPGLDVIADGWGYIDATALGEDPDVMASLGMQGSADWGDMLAMLDEVGDVLDGGAGNIDGIPTRIVYAAIDLGDLAGLMEGQADDFPAELEDLPPVSLEVHVDDADRVRRLEYNLDLSAMVPPEEQVALGAMDLVMWQRIDFTDFGEAIEIAVPVGAPDITEQMVQLMEMAEGF